MKSKVIIVIPAYNAEAALEKLFRDRGFAWKKEIDYKGRTNKKTL